MARLMHFYERFAPGLGPIIAAFEDNGQHHLAQPLRDALNTDHRPADDGVLYNELINKRLNDSVQPVEGGVRCQ
jgi:hypothetical protein